VELIEGVIAGINLPTAIAAALLVLAVLVIIKLGRLLLMAAVLGAVAGGVALGQGHTTENATAHAVVGFAIAAMVLLLIKFVRNLVLWVVITALGAGALLLDGLNP
jgi:hypothetical protein